MRKLIASTFVSLDGVIQAPGAPDEDPTHGFTLGGWSCNFWDETMNVSASGLDGKDRELVLGRKTYEIFEAHWPYQPSNDPTAIALNAAKKHVASRTLNDLQWNNSAVLQGDVVKAITHLKAQPGFDLQIIGSANLIQTLQAAALIDEYNVWTFPVVLGRGKRLFEASAKPCAFKLVRSQLSTSGVVMSTYILTGDIPLGSFAQSEPSAKEIQRRARMASEN